MDTIYKNLGSKKHLQIVLESESPVLLTGPTGSGKSTFAEKLHQMGARHQGPFVTVNLASFHEGTIESELFGAEKGAYTGSCATKKGQLELAEGGTLFLDEVSELSLPFQARLLEFLQTQNIKRLGSERPKRLNVRVISASNRNLWQEVSAGRFRKDLFFRLRSLEIKLPALNNLDDEFGNLVHDLIEQYAEKLKKTIHRVEEKAAISLEKYDWPGNYRELHSVLEYAVRSSENEIILESDLPPWFAEGRGSMADSDGECEVALFAPSQLTMNYEDDRKRFDYQYLTNALEQTRGNYREAASLIGLSKATFWRKMKCGKGFIRTYAMH